MNIAKNNFDKWSPEEWTNERNGPKLPIVSQQKLRSVYLILRLFVLRPRDVDKLFANLSILFFFDKIQISIYADFL